MVASCRRLECIDGSISAHFELHLYISKKKNNMTLSLCFLRASVVHDDEWISAGVSNVMRRGAILLLGIGIYLLHSCSAGISIIRFKYL